ncbi:MAG: nucleoside monophosphate kinase [Mycoplasmataceae bacterium]|jgi:adenylate kinase|nr:nucleoside monophosphate kinase [Mycoplasmataceae bacterium]
MVKKNYYIVLLGAPGSGKGTLAKHLVERYGFKHLSTGDMFRKTIAKNTSLGLELKSIVVTGALVNDDVTNSIIKSELLELISNHTSFILDGFPRTIEQAKFLDSLIKPNLILLVDVQKKLAIQRVVGRRLCPKCGTIYNVYFKPPKISNVCDYDGEFLIQRKDDNQETISKRFDLYQEITSKLEDYYRDSHHLYHIDANAGIDVILPDVIKLIGQ